MSSSNPRPVQPSLGESIIERVKKLNLGDDVSSSRSVSMTSKKSRTGKEQETSQQLDANRHTEHYREIATSAIEQPVTNSVQIGLPKPTTSETASFSPKFRDRTTRQPKRLSSIPLVSDDKKRMKVEAGTGTDVIAINQSRVIKRPVAHHQFGPNHVRSQSRHRVTAQGSPYAIPRSSTPNHGAIKSPGSSDTRALADDGTVVPSGESARSCSAQIINPSQSGPQLPRHASDHLILDETHSLDQLPEAFAVNIAQVTSEASSKSMSVCKSGLPLPTRLIKHSPLTNNEGELNQQRMAVNLPNTAGFDTCDKDLDTDIETSCSKNSLATAHNLNHVSVGQSLFNNKVENASHTAPGKYIKIVYE
jgi:hypothetical protein